MRISLNHERSEMRLCVTGFEVLSSVVMNSTVRWKSTLRRNTSLPSSRSKNKPSKKPTWKLCLQNSFHAAFIFDFLFDSDDGSPTFLRNVDWLSTDYTALYPKTENSPRLCVNWSSSYMKNYSAEMYNAVFFYLSRSCGQFIWFTCTLGNHSCLKDEPAAWPRQAGALVNRIPPWSARQTRLWLINVATMENCSLGVTTSMSYEIKSLPLNVSNGCQLPTDQYRSWLVKNVNVTAIGRHGYWLTIINGTAQSV
jgi:hypothetical protein